MLSFVYSYVGAPDGVLDFVEDSYDAGAVFTPRVFGLWYPSYAPVRKTERLQGADGQDGHGRLLARPRLAEVLPTGRRR